MSEHRGSPGFGYGGGGRGGFSTPRGGFSTPRGGFSSPRGDFSSPRGGRGYGSPYGDRGGFSSPRGRGRGGYSAGPETNTPMPAMVRHPSLVKQKLPHGTAGRRIELVANFYRLATTNVDVFHYDMEIKKKNGNGDKPSSLTESSKSSSDTPSEEQSTNMERFIKKFSHKIVERMFETSTILRGVLYVYDGTKSLYTTSLINMGGHKHLVSNVEIDVDDRPTEFTIKLKMAERVDVGEVIEFYMGRKQELAERAISIYEHLFRFIMGRQYKTFQRKFYDLTNIQASPRVQLAEFVQGFTSGVRATEFGLALNVHLKTSCIISRNIVRLTDIAEIIAGIRPGTRPKPFQVMDLNKFVRHLQIFTEHTNRQNTYTIDGIIDRCPRDMEFETKDGGKVSVSDHFMNEYHLELLVLPLVKTTGKARYLPMEMCFLMPNQFLSNQKINTQIQRELLLKSTNTPNVYFSKLDSVVKKVASNDSETQQSFGVQLETKPVAFTGRVLDTPRQLNADMRGQFFSTKPPPARWGVFIFDNEASMESVHTFVGQMMDRARFFGLTLAQPNPVAKVEVQNPNSIFNAFSNLSRRTQAQFVFVGIPINKQNLIAPARIYGLVKQCCDQTVGIISQCFKTEYLQRTPGGYFDNFLLKVNGKLGGLNAVIDQTIVQTLPFDMKRTMMVGIDINHPNEFERVASSVAAAVGSTDERFSAYSASIRVQKKDREEIVKDMESMMSELLNQYFKANHIYPETIIAFRDGVAEGQFGQVYKVEIPMLQTAISRVNTTVKVVFIVTQKHHNTRFALTQINAQPRRPTWNVPSGTVVDNTIVSPQYKMFYLNSHFSPLGTSRPTKYVILRDDFEMDADTIQKMCFIACYNSIRTRSVIATPTPVRYADLAAYRSKLHIEAQYDLLKINVSSGDTEEFEREVIKQLNDIVNINEGLRDRLYYC